MMFTFTKNKKRIVTMTSDLASRPGGEDVGNILSPSDALGSSSAP